MNLTAQYVIVISFIIDEIVIVISSIIDEIVLVISFIIDEIEEFISFYLPVYLSQFIVTDVDFLTNNKICT